MKFYPSSVRIILYYPLDTLKIFALVPVIENWIGSFVRARFWFTILIIRVSFIVCGQSFHLNLK